MRFYTDTAYMVRTRSHSAAIAVDLGATHIRAGLVRSDGCILAHASAQTPRAPTSPDDLIDTLDSLIRRTVSRDARGSAEGIGVSIAGPVDLRQGAVVNPPNIPLPFIPLADPLRERFSLPVCLMNDCHAGALGEAAYGGARGIPNFVYLTISTGIGAGVYEHGRLLMGEDGNFAEVGHFLVETSWNLPCGCGGIGHWEGCGSGRFTPSFFQEWCRSSGFKSPFSDPPDTAAIFARSDQGDPVIREFLAILGTIHATGISSLISAYDPSLIILDGSVVRKNWKTFSALTLPKVRSVSGKMPKIEMSTLEGNAPLLGAAVGILCITDRIPRE